MHRQKNFYRRERHRRKSSASRSSQNNKLKCTYCKLEGHLEKFCQKKYLKKVPNHNKPNKVSSKKDKDPNKNLEKGKYRNKKVFARFAVIIQLKINIIVINTNNCSALELSANLSMALFDYKNSQYFDTNAINYFCIVRNIFISYIRFIIS